MGFREKYHDTELNSLAIALDNINDLYDSGDLSREEALELIADVERSETLQEKCQDVKLKSDFIKALNLLSKVI